MLYLIISYLLVIRSIHALIKLPIKRDGSRLNSRDYIGVSLYNANAREYLIELGVGTPVQYFNVTLDTGSSDLWIPSVECSRKICPYSRFNALKSTSFNRTGASFNIQYGSGSAHGHIGYDTITLKGYPSLANQVLGLAVSTEGMAGPSLSKERASGILGLGFPGLMTTDVDNQQLPLIMNLFHNEIIHDPVFSIHLNRQDRYGYTGEIVIGGYETDRYIGRLNYLPVVMYDTNTNRALLGRHHDRDGNGESGYKYWTVPGQSIVVYSHSKNDILYRTPSDELQPVILDTGTTLSYLPKEIVMELLETVTLDYKSIRLNSEKILAYEVKCHDFINQSHDLWFEIEFSSSRTSFIKDPINIRVPLIELILPQDSQDIHQAKSCLFGIAPHASTMGGWILGQTILRSAYIVHDMLEYQIGIAAASNGYSTFDTKQSNSGHNNYMTSSTTLCIYIIVYIYSIALLISHSEGN
ncbi:aspartic peptidase domain-containing protein [Pilobolus umbonatus]|nr:aspartic peptidase domain-containing protein [Pilobolus umbonatus]